MRKRECSTIALFLLSEKVVSIINYLKVGKIEISLKSKKLKILYNAYQ